MFGVFVLLLAAVSVLIVKDDGASKIGESEIVSGEY
jgi:hypothetical protein